MQIISLHALDKFLELASTNKPDSDIIKLDEDGTD
jgi:hypothetical protein